MCGRYIFAKNRKDLLRRYGLDKDFDEHGSGMPVYSLPLFNIAPTLPMPVIVFENGRRVLKIMRWGLIAPWSEEPRMKLATINARVEGIATSPLYRGPFKNRRCLVPATGYYEWNGPAKARIPHCIQKCSHDIFSFAGIWERWQSKDKGQTIETFSVVTTPANKFVLTIHTRMPAILEERDEDRWLNPDTPIEECLALLNPYPFDDLCAHRASPVVNKAGIEGPELAAPIETAIADSAPAQLDFTTFT